MTEDGIRNYVGELGGVDTMVADEASGAPEVAWGDTFFFYDPDGTSARRMPFATIVTSDYDGVDSIIGRPGVFRLNISVGRTVFETLVGYPPAAHPDHHGEFDYTATDRLLPNPVYAQHGWVSVLNPAEATAEHARSLLRDAHARAARPRPSR